MEYYSAMRKKEILPFLTTWMDLEGIKPDRERQILHGIVSMWNLKKGCQGLEDRVNRERLVKGYKLSAIR